MLCTLILHHFCRTQNRKFYPVIHWMNYLTKLDRSVYSLNSNTPHSTPQALNLLKLNTLPRATFGRGSGRRGSNFSEYPQGFRLVLISPQWLRVDPRTTSYEPSNSLLVGLYAGLLSWLTQTHHGRSLPWVPSFLGWLSDLDCCDKSWLKALKLLYLQYISNGVKMGGIKSFPPLVLVWKHRLRGDRYKSLELPTLQSMSNLTLFERYSQARLFSILGMAIATLTQATEGGEG